MKLHRNARTCPNSRALIARRVLDAGWSLAAAAEAAGVSVTTARKWVARALTGQSLEDRSSAPHSIPHRTAPERVAAIRALRRLRMTAAEISELLGLALSTVSSWLKRIGLGKRSRLDPPEPPNRYERRRPGELVHVDVKKLARISVRGAGHRVLGHRRSQFEIRVAGERRRKVTGYEFVHVMVDDHSRLAYAETLEDERAETAVGFLRRGLSWFSERGVEVERVMSDNGSCYRSRLHAVALHQLGLKHIRTRPYRPRTNGKAERFIQTLVNEWAHGRIYGSTAERRKQLAPWLVHYNYSRRHGALGHRPPATRLTT